MQRKAFITGVTGQDGYYLSRLLLEEGTQVYGLVRRCSRDLSLASLHPDVKVVSGDVCDPAVARSVCNVKPDEIYNLAAMSHVGESFNQASTVMRVNAGGALNMLEAAKSCGARFYQASTSELFGNCPAPQNENSPFGPRSPYAIAKLAAFHLTVMHREAYDMHASNGILFNHESPRRGADFVTQKVCRTVARIRDGEAITLKMGNLDACRDWGHAQDFVRGMVRMVRNDAPGDYVLATGITRSIRELLDVAFMHIGIADWAPYVETDPAYYRPLDVNHLHGDISKAERVLNWRPRYTFNRMIAEMVDAFPVSADIRYLEAAV